jgi:hypothetical protein
MNEVQNSTVSEVDTQANAQNSTVREFETLNDAQRAGFHLPTTKVVNVKVSRVIPNETFTTIVFIDLLTGQQIVISLKDTQFNYLGETFTDTNCIYQLSISDNTNKSVYATYSETEYGDKFMCYKSFYKPCKSINGVVSKFADIGRDTLVGSIMIDAKKDNFARSLFDKSFEDLDMGEKQQILNLV